MAFDFDALVLAPLAALFNRPVYVTPRASQPNQPSYWARADYRVQNVDIATQEGIESEQTLKAGARIADFLVPVAPKDQVYFPAHLSLPAAGPFWVDDTDDDAQGHTEWLLKLAKPTPQNMPAGT